MRVVSLTVLAVFAISAAGWGDAVAGCPCPKENMIKKHGTVSMIEPSPTPPIDATSPVKPAPTADAANDESAESLDRVVGTGYSPDPELQ